MGNEMQRIREFARVVSESSVKGWLNMEEAVFLAACAAKTPGGRYIVEVGSYQGLSTLFLGYGSQLGSMPKVYAVDPHEPVVHNNAGVYGSGDQQEFYKNISDYRLGNMIYALSVQSTCAAGAFVDKTVGLLFIDGDHSQRAVEADIAAWVPKVDYGGLILFHDRCEAGVFDALRRCPDVMQVLGVVEQIAVFLRRPNPFGVKGQEEYNWPLELMLPIRELVERENAASA